MTLVKNRVFKIFLKVLKKHCVFTKAKKTLNNCLNLIYITTQLTHFRIKLFIINMLIIVWVLIKSYKNIISGKKIYIPHQLIFNQCLMLSIKWVVNHRSKTKLPLEVR